MGYKLEPGHFHLQAHGITRVSRTVQWFNGSMVQWFNGSMVQWFLEVSDRKYSGLKRIADEVAITSAYLASFNYFLFDNSENFTDTRSFLNQLINRVNSGHNLFF
ncbi:hypothetical protein GCM10022277_29040 [Litoribacillus peritrichatus]|uniref:COQ9 C-terminal domain-containing protein n=2 Tax=Litoribacillus peritrichatus TaxID=718191 RepID=A0ABP7MX40_9GAMM